MDERLKRQQNESDDQYFYRICKMRESLGFTWYQMADIFNEEFGCDKGDTAYRKRWNAFERVLNANVDQILGEDAYLEELREAKRELEKERQKLYATKLEANRSLRQESRAELFYENIKNALTTLSVPQLMVNLSNKANKDKEYVLCVADIQAGAQFNIECNEYSLEICAQRFEKLLNMVVAYVIQNNINKLKVVGLGDDVQGILRLSDVKLNETSVVEATMTVARLMANFLNELSAYCVVDYYHTGTSNHSQTRNLGSKANELVFEDMEYVIGNYIHDVLAANSRVGVHLNNGCDYIDVPVFDFNVMAMHGHTIKNIETALRDMSMMRRKLIDYIFIGHFHNGKVVPGNAHESHDTELLMCPSFQGADPYALNKLGKSSKAACKMFIFDAKYGCTGTEKFILN